MSVSTTHAPFDELLLTRETPVQRRRVRAAWLFLTPMLVCLALVAAWPLQVNAEGRVALWERLKFSLDGEPDPWFDFDKARVDTRQFTPVGAAHEAISQGAAQ
jgi:ABC-type sugar transport system permease subunit